MILVTGGMGARRRGILITIVVLIMVAKNGEALRVMEKNCL